MSTQQTSKLTQFFHWIRFNFCVVFRDGKLLAIGRATVSHGQARRRQQRHAQFVSKQYNEAIPMGLYVTLTGTRDVKSFIFKQSDRFLDRICGLLVAEPTVKEKHVNSTSFG